MNAKEKRASLLAVLAAALYSLTSPFSKILLSDIPPTLMAALLYLGAGVGVLILMIIRGAVGGGKTETKYIYSRSSLLISSLQTQTHLIQFLTYSYL